MLVPIVRYVAMCLCVCAVLSFSCWCLNRCISLALCSAVLLLSALRLYVCDVMLSLCMYLCVVRCILVFFVCY